MNDQPKNFASITNWKFVGPSIVLLAIAGYLVFRGPSVVELPGELGGVPRVQLVAGEKANEILNRMHDKEVTPRTNLIGMYSGGNGNAVVYLSVYRSSGDAQGAYNKMARSIEKGNLLFSNSRPVRIGSLDGTFCVGQGQDHYFFAHNESLYWLAADSRDAAKMANELVKSIE